MDTIAIIIAVNNEESKNRIEQLFNSVKAVEYCNIELYFINKNGNTASAYNKVICMIKADYKLYIREDVREMSSEWLFHLIRRRSTYGKKFAIGFLGSYLTISGNFLKKNKIYGSYRYIKDCDIITTNACGNVYRKVVNILDSAVLFTNVNIKWNESVGEYFYMAAYCSELRKENINPFILEDVIRYEPVMGRPSDFEYVDDIERYERELHEFNYQYKDVLRPLVSIGIPTYNNPNFFKLALESALSQDYDNIEIIIGDDSTNDDTKELMQVYLSKYKNIKYINNGGPLGQRGGINSRNILNSCSGDYINLLYHDDIIYPKKISTMMEVFAQDVERSIGFVTSGRNIINENGEIFIPYRNNKNNLYERIDGRLFGKEFFISYSNYIGEHSTVLIRRECLQLKNSELDIGRFWGIKDWNIGDISTWLDICRKKDFIYIHEALSEFRLTLLESQNSNDEEMNIEAKFEYLLMTVMAWLNEEYIYNENEFKNACICWQRVIYPGISVKNEDKISEKVMFKIKFMIACDKLITQNNMNVLLDLLIRYLIVNEENDADLHLYCKYDEENEKWIKRNR